MNRAFLVCLLLLAACRDRQPEQPTPKQSDQLNETEDMLNAMARNEEGPEANASGPFNSSN